MTKSLIYIALILGLLFLAACAGEYDIASPVHEDPIWRAQAITDLAMDFRHDGRFDFEADPSLEAVNDRLAALEYVPSDVLYPLQIQASKIEWDGK
ncbi:MAG: hypothetical protein AAF546_00260 [Verrucomicrobiota bacterium]